MSSTLADPGEFPLAGDVVYVTTSQMVEVDRAMVEDYAIDLTRMMESAGRCLADLARSRFLSGDPRGREVVVLAGPGGNGGGALVAARRLANWGATVYTELGAARDDYAPVPAAQLDILERMDVLIAAGASPKPRRADLIIDGLIGYSLRGAPRGHARELIDWANAQDAPVLSLDTPSGLELTEGAVSQPTINATATMTLALPKAGLAKPASRPYVGELYLADIGVPPALYARIGLPAAAKPLFARADILRVF